jgi:hypothetical protein
MQPMTIKLRLCALILLSCWLAPCLATPQIAVYHLEGLHNQQQSGSYDTLILKVKDLGVDLNLQFSPILRAKHSFNNNEIDCISPADSSGDPYPFPTVQTSPINMAKAYIFRRKGDSIIGDPMQLAGLKVGIRTGMNFGNDFEKIKKLVHIELVRDIELNYKKLMAKRIDAFVAYTPDIWNLLGSHELPTLVYDKNHPLLIHPESIVCHDSPENRDFITQFDQALIALIKDGVVKEILGISYGLD